MVLYALASKSGSYFPVHDLENRYRLWHHSMIKARFIARSIKTTAPAVLMWILKASQVRSIFVHASEFFLQAVVASVLCNFHQVEPSTYTDNYCLRRVCHFRELSCLPAFRACISHHRLPTCGTIDLVPKSSTAKQVESLEWS
jgi:hypothetical protein